MYSRWQWLPKLCHEAVTRHLPVLRWKSERRASRISNYLLDSNTAYPGNVSTRWNGDFNVIKRRATARRELTSCTPTVWSSQNALWAQRCSLDNMCCVSVAVDCVWNVMAHAQKPDFVFRRNGRVHLNRRGRQFSRLLAAEVCASAVVMLHTPCS
jgi:hypothetical protein